MVPSPEVSLGRRGLYRVIRVNEDGKNDCSNEHNNIFENHCEYKNKSLWPHTYGFSLAGKIF